MADSALILAFIGVVALTCFKQTGDELKMFFNNMIKIQNNVQQYSKDAANSDST